MKNVGSNKNLEEAWITMRWKLQESSIDPEFKKDPSFPIALGTFASEVSEKFPFVSPRKESEAPLDLLPHIPRYQFKLSENTDWPLLQLGPGVATLNYSKSYSWNEFLKNALFLREKTLRAYSSTKIKPKSISLRYRNAIKFDFSKKNFLDFLSNNINYTVKMPEKMLGEKEMATELHHTTVFQIFKPKAKGLFRVATGYKKDDKKDNPNKKNEYIVYEIEIFSNGDSAPDFYNKRAFETWLENAHVTTNKWFDAIYKKG